MSAEREKIRKLREPIYSRAQARLMLDLALMLKDSEPDVDNATLIEEVVTLTNLAMERGREAARAATDRA